MTARAWTTALLAAAVAAQLAAPAWMIARREAALRRGVVLRFRTAPVDPYDAFRGRYVALSFDGRSAPCPDAVRRRQTVYVCAEADTNGFARLTRAALRPDAAGVWFRARASHGPGPNGAGDKTLPLDLPFDRFYMDERAAPRAEELYRRANRRGGPQDAWLQVRVHRGLAVPEDLYVSGRPIREMVLRWDGETKP